MKQPSDSRKRSKIQNDELIKPEIDDGFRDFLTTAYEYLVAQQDNCKNTYNLADYESWDYDQETGLLEFSDSGVVKLRIKYEEVGSVSKISKTWLWAWANPNLLETVKSEIDAVRKFGELKHYERVTKRKWYADEYDGWEMTAISALVLKAKGAYRVPTEKTFSFFIFKEIEDLRKLD